MKSQNLKNQQGKGREFVYQTHAAGDKNSLLGYVEDRNSES